MKSDAAGVRGDAAHLGAAGAGGVAKAVAGEKFSQDGGSRR